MSNLPKGGYGIVSRMAMRSDKVSKESKAVYALLCSYSGGKHYCYPTVATIAKDLGMSERTAIRLTEELQKNGFVNKVKVSNNKRKTAYIPLFPYGGIGDTDDIIQEIGDMDGTINGDMDGTLIITSNSNSKDAPLSMLPNLKQSKPKRKNVHKENPYPEVGPLLNILSENGVKQSTISTNLKRLMLNTIEAHGLEFCELALRGRIIQAEQQGKPLYLTTFFDPEKGEWMNDCSKIVAKKALTILPKADMAEIDALAAEMGFAKQA
mgnify:CR=1 FL=1